MPVDSQTSLTPELSVVIASVNGWETLKATLDALDAQPERARMEIVVVDRLGGAIRENIRARSPQVNLIEVNEPLSIPRLRHRGAIATRGEIVAILEDHTAVESGWARAFLTVREGPWAAIGGAVENGRKGLLSRAVFFCEYAPYMRPVVEGDAIDLPGNNIAYKRPHLMKHVRLLEEGRWESWINDRLRADGDRLRSTNAAVARHIKTFKLGYFLRQRYHFARSYAGMRRPDQTLLKRFVYAIGSSLLPFVLTLRVSRTVLAKKRDLGWFLACLPLIFLFFTVGAIGESLGYAFGSGSSLERVE
ncbi:MAG: hypothetical protein NVSMB14_04040 [Isosphaeraceae bacterium]